MGLAASQARFLSLTARKTNVEYEGQQINQQRTVLANQSANLVNQMLSMEVPTPPVASDYSKTTYVFTDPTSSDTLSIDYIMPPYLDENGQTRYSVQTTRNYSDWSATYFNLADISIIPPTNADDNKDYKITCSVGSNMTITGPTTATGLAKPDYFGKAEQAATGLEGTGADYSDDNSEYYFTFSNNQTQYYIPALSKDETIEELYERLNGKDCNAFAVQGVTKTETKAYNDVILSQSNDGTGRYESMTYVDEATQRTITMSLTQQTVQDEEAYDEAMETYNAKKAIYDKTVAEIDAKTALIQQQDKNLELHLQQLDTEQQAIQTEMENVKKVIDKNIEETFKIFG